MGPKAKMGKPFLEPIQVDPYHQPHTTKLIYAFKDEKKLNDAMQNERDSEIMRININIVKLHTLVCVYFG